MHQPFFFYTIPCWTIGLPCAEGRCCTQRLAKLGLEQIIFDVGSFIHVRAEWKQIQI